MGHTLDSLRKMYESMRFMFSDAPKDTTAYKEYELWRDAYFDALKATQHN